MSSPRPPARPAPRRVSQRRYMVRRLVALTVLGALVLGVVRLGAVLLGGEEQAQASPTATVASTDQDGSADVSSAEQPGATVPAATAGSAAPSTEPVVADTGPPTASSPATVLIAGDSDAGTFGPYLEQLLDETGVVETVLDYKVSSGLARPDFFDWPAELRTKIPAVDPDIVVVTFGGNDAQGLADQNGNFIVGEPKQDGDNAEWRAEYGRRVGEVMDYLSADGRTVIWVGIPNDDNPDVTFRMQVQDETAKAEAAKRPEVVFVDTWARFSGRNGGWAEYVIDPRDGQGKDVRADDGFHLNTTGAEILALDIAEHIKSDLRARGAEI